MDRSRADWPDALANEADLPPLDTAKLIESVRGVVGLRWERWPGKCFLASDRTVAQVPQVDHDIVFLNGRVLDPDSGLDAIRNVDIVGRSIRSVSDQPLRGRVVIDATGLVIAPGFIDLHQDDHNAGNYPLKAMDGVTTALKMVNGTADIDSFYAEHEGGALINFGASVAHTPVRMIVMHDPGARVPTGVAAHKLANSEETNKFRNKSNAVSNAARPELALIFA
jgi:hypothetical protein